MGHQKKSTNMEDRSGEKRRMILVHKFICWEALLSAYLERPAEFIYGLDVRRSKRP